MQNAVYSSKAAEIQEIYNADSEERHGFELNPDAGNSNSSKEEIEDANLNSNKDEDSNEDDEKEEIIAATAAATFAASEEKPKRRKVISVTSFNGELEVLLVRLEEMKSVDHFVISESEFSQSMERKSLTFLSFVAKEPYLANLMDRISYFPIHNLSNMASHDDLWANEVYVRDAPAAVLDHLNLDPNDIILISDLDEILSSEFIDSVTANLKQDQVAIAKLQWNLYNFCWVHKSTTTIPVALTFSTYKKHFSGSLSRVRGNRFDIEKRSFDEVFNGWHCSWCFENDLFRKKVISMTLADPGYAEWRKLNWTDEKINHLRKNGLWLTEESHGLHDCSKSPFDILKPGSEDWIPEFNRKNSK
jgi:hypothetical protein